MLAKEVDRIQLFYNATILETNGNFYLVLDTESGGSGGRANEKFGKTHGNRDCHVAWWIAIGQFLMAHLGHGSGWCSYTSILQYFGMRR
jgi:hypothetical protein